MSIRTARIVPDLQVYRFRGVSKEYGRAVMEELERQGEISVEITSTGRRRLSFEDAEKLAQAL